MKTGSAGILSKISQATKNPACKALCGKILNGMSDRKSTVTYSEGSIVAALSTFVEGDSSEEEMVVEMVEISMREDTPVLVKDGVMVPKIEYKRISPSWDTFKQKGNKEVKPLPAFPEMSTITLNPPKVFTLQTNGSFDQIQVPYLGKVILENIDLVSEDEFDEDSTDGGGGSARSTPRSKRSVKAPSPPRPKEEDEWDRQMVGGFQKLDLGELGGFEEGKEED